MVLRIFLHDKRTVATSAFGVRRYLTTRPDLIHSSARSHPESSINSRLTPNLDHFLAHKTARISFPNQTRVRICTHKVHIFIEYHSEVPELGLPHPLSHKLVCPPPGTKGGPPRGRAHSPASERAGESQFRRLGKKLSTLSILCLHPEKTSGSRTLYCTNEYEYFSIS